MESSEYAQNLIQYLDQSRSITNLTMGDLRNVLTGLNGSIFNNNQMISNPSHNNATIDGFLCVEHVVCIWHDEQNNRLNWYLGVVDNDVGNQDIVNVSYMKRTDKRGLRWLFPEEAEILETSKKNGFTATC